MPQSLKKMLAIKLILTRQPLFDYALDGDEKATRFLTHTDLAYFKHNIDSSAAEKNYLLGL